MAIKSNVTKQELLAEERVHAHTGNFKVWLVWDVEGYHVLLVKDNGLDEVKEDWHFDTLREAKFGVDEMSAWVLERF